MSVRVIRELLVATIWICALTIPTIAQIDAIPNELDAENGSERACPKSCNCTEGFIRDSFTARCTELIRPEYSEANIANFVFEKTGDVKLGENDLRVRGLDHVQAIEITHPDEQSSSFPFFTWINTTCAGTLNIHPDIFKNKTELKFLVIQQFETLVDHSDTTGGYLFDAPSVEKLIFSVLNYKPWSASTFEKMPNLKSIYLVDRNFTLDSKIFTPIPKLLSLKIESAHSWTDIGANDFILVQSLEELIIRDGITRIHADAFSHLSKLKHLDISGNKIESFTDKHLRNNPKLEALIMNFNVNLKLLPVFKLEDAHSSYSIRDFQCSPCGLETIVDGTFSAMPFLERLDLSGNHLKSLPHGFFKPLTSLKSLDLSYNRISHIPTSMFEGANELSDLYLSRNPITTLDIVPFLAAPKLMKLYLDRCRIETWKATSTPHYSLSTLSIESNSLKNITVEHLQQISNISTLKLIYNPVSCVQFKDIIIWSQAHNVTTEFFTVDNTLCIPWYGETCWIKFHEIVCSNNYTSVLDEIEQDRNRFFEIAPKTGENKANASAINQIMISLILIVTTITVAINNECHILYI